MDRKIPKEYYLQTQEHEALGALNSARRRDIVAELRNEGHGTKEAREKLSVFFDQQDAHIAHRDRLRQEFTGDDRGRLG